MTSKRRPIPAPRARPRCAATPGRRRQGTDRLAVLHSAGPEERQGAEHGRRPAARHKGQSSLSTERKERVKSEVNVFRRWRTRAITAPEQYIGVGFDRENTLRLAEEAAQSRLRGVARLVWLPFSWLSGWMESNTWCPRLTAWIILSGSAVHVKGFDSALCSTTKRLIAACKSTT